MRYDLKHKPVEGSIVTIEPTKKLTLELIAVDKNHTFHCKKVVGVVLDDNYYITHCTSSNIHKLKMINVVPIKTTTGELLLVPPEFLTTVDVNTKKVKRKTTLQKFLDNIAIRVNELKS